MKLSMTNRELFSAVFQELIDDIQAGRSELAYQYTIKLTRIARRMF